MKARNLLISILSVMSWCVLNHGLAAPPFRPNEDSTILERTRTGPPSEQDLELRRLRETARKSPTDLPGVLAWVQSLRERSRRDSDPRFLSQALAAMNPWNGTNGLPIDLLVQRAGIRQSLHDFDGALSDLDKAIQVDPRRADAWLLKSTIHCLRGEFTSARIACVPLARFGNELISVAAAAQVASMTGEAARSYETLATALERSRKTHRNPPNAESKRQQAWAETLMAEIAVRLGKNSEAEEHFRNVLMADPKDVYALGAFADFLLDQRRLGEVTRLLDPESSADGLLLRLAEAEVFRDPTRRGTANPSQVAQTLQRRFEASHSRGDFIHQREEARFAGRVQSRHADAMRLALENWKIQKEAPDVRILLECAIASGQESVADQVREWIRTNRFEDLSLLDKIHRKSSSPRF